MLSYSTFQCLHMFNWIVLGDFNEMLNHDGKIGSRFLSPSQLKRLPELLTSTNSFDVPLAQLSFMEKSDSQLNHL